MSRPKQMVLLVAAVIVLLLGLGVILYDKYNIVASNMAPTLEPGAEVIMRTGSTPTINDIIIFDIPNSVSSQDRPIVSRVIAIGGQEVTLAGGEVFIDGALIAEPFLNEPASSERREMIPGCVQDVAASDRCVVPDGFLFVMGDHRRGSTDSRSFGPVDAETVRGVLKDPPFWMPNILIVG